MKRKKLGRRKVSPLIYIGFCGLAVGVVYNGYTLSKYIFSDNKEPVYVAKNFYFESDMLEKPTNGSYPKYDLQDGVDTIEFSLRNYPDKLRCSEVDIGYTVELSKGGAVVDSTTGILEGYSSDGNSNFCNDVIKFDGLEAGTYIVIASAVSPYSSTLKASFTINEDEERVSYSVSDASGSPVLQLTVRTGDYEGNVSISWSDDVEPDNTDELMKTASGGSHVVYFEKYAEYTFTFFKSDPSASYRAVFTVKEG